MQNFYEQYIKSLKALSNKMKKEKEELEKMDKGGIESVNNIPDLVNFYTMAKLTEERPPEEEKKTKQKAELRENLKAINEFTTRIGGIKKPLSRGGEV